MSNVTAMSAVPDAGAALAIHGWDADKLALIREHIAPGCNDSEFAYFLEVANAMGLNPLKREIYAIKRWDKRAQKEKITFQTSIDGYRKIAHGTSEFVGCSDVAFHSEPGFRGGQDLVATVTVRRSVQGAVGEWAASARYSEYVQTFQDGNPMHMWAKMPKTMLGKCAEALALRKAFPNELGGVYTQEEMAQADVVDVTPAPQVRGPEALPKPPGDPKADLRKWWFAVTADLHKQDLVPDIRALDDEARHAVQEACLGFPSFSDATPEQVVNKSLRPRNPEEMVQRINDALDAHRAEAHAVSDTFNEVVNERLQDIKDTEPTL